VISNNNDELDFIAEEMTEFLNDHLPPLPDTSPVKDFLEQPNDYGWKVKKKLIWLGTKSYLFRRLFDEYFEDNHTGERSPILTIDDFICQDATLWSGLGAVDMLATCLNVPDEQKEELRTWYLRHFSIYKIIKTDTDISEAVNLVNDTTYLIRHGAPTDPTKPPFRPNSIIQGGLVPWRGEWYWSGTQYDFTPLSKHDFAATLTRFKEKTQFVARFSKEREEKVRQLAKEDFQGRHKFHGNNLVLFPNGRAYERAQTKWFIAHAKSLGFAGHMPNVVTNENLRECEDGIAMFLDPLEGEESMMGFNNVMSGLKKNGRTCTPDEAEMIRDWIWSTAISPAFIHRVLKEYGGEESIKYAFRWDTNDSYWLEYMLRCNKGTFYRPRRFPCVDLCSSRD
jgi:hypothetical protein